MAELETISYLECNECNKIVLCKNLQTHFLSFHPKLKLSYRPVSNTKKLNGLLRELQNKNETIYIDEDNSLTDMETVHENEPPLKKKRTETVASSSGYAVKNRIQKIPLNSPRRSLRHKEPVIYTSKRNIKVHKPAAAEYKEKADYDDLLALDDVDLVSNVEKFKCPGCSFDVKIGEGVTLKDCLHSFCKKCLADAIQNSNAAIVKCPFQNDEYSCESYLQEREVKSLVTPAVYEQHLQRSIAFAESEAQGSFHCKTPDCPGWGILEGNVTTFFCPVCRHSNCLMCDSIHEGMNCQKYQNDVFILYDNSDKVKKTKGLESEIQNVWESGFEKDDASLVYNEEKFLCPICILDVEVNEGVTLKNCFHSFCKKCLVNAIQNSKNFVVKCPFPNAGYFCEGYLQDKEVKSLVIPEVYVRHFEKRTPNTKSQALKTVHCKTPNCTGWLYFEENIDVFFCPVCKHTNCLKCGEIHKEKNCMQHQMDRTLQPDSIEEARKMREFLQNEVHEAGQADKKSNYLDLIALDYVELVSNAEKFECPICFCEIEVGEGVTLRDCFHCFCKVCLAGVIQFSEFAVVKCPFQNGEYSCESYLQERDIKSLVTPEIYEKHLQRSMSLAESQAEDSFHCKTPDCPGWCLFENDVNFFPCPVCNHTNCITCAAIHEGKNCKQYQDNLIFLSDSNEDARKTKAYLQKMINTKKAMQCPKCQVILMKKSGCDGMTCSMCKTPLCWATKGPRWGPKGVGDTSGGCGCNRAVGVLCHPKCKGCH